MFFLYYVVEKGNQLGIYNDLATVFQYNKGWEGPFKVTSFDKLKEARKHITNTNIPKKVIQNSIKKTDKLFIYVDGSYMQSKNLYGIGVVIVEGEKIVSEQAIQIKNQTQKIQLHEWYAVYEGLKAIKHFTFSKAILYTDSLTICSIFNGSNTKIKQKSKSAYLNIASLLKNNEKKISIRHIKSHKGNFYNERADFLAGIAAEKNENISNTPITVSQPFSTMSSTHIQQLSSKDKDSIVYIESLIKKSQLPIENSWVCWDSFCNTLNKLISLDNKTFKFGKLKKNNIFLDKFEIKTINNIVHIRKKTHRG